MASTNSKPTRRCHWVPQSYLKGFAADSRKPARIWRLSNQNGEPELKRIDKVAVRNHLYSFRDADGRRDDAQEKRFSELETFFSSEPWRALQTGFVDLSSQPLRKMVALLAATMFVRNPAHFETLKRIHSSIVDFFSELDSLPDVFDFGAKQFEIDHESWPSFANSTDEDLKKDWFAVINTCGDIARHFLEMRWAVTVSDAPVFITSDNPVTFIHPDLRFRGYANPETSIVFPISPTRALHMDHRHGELDNEYYEVQHDGAAINMLVWRHANEYMFSQRDPLVTLEGIVKLGNHLERNHPT